MPTAEKTATTNKETWLDWLPHTTDARSRDEFIEAMNQEHGGNLTAEQLQSWEDRGLLPLPIQGAGYPDNAGLIVRALRTLDRDPDDIPSEHTRTVLRAVAKTINEKAARDIRDHLQDRLAELEQEDAARRETWIDWVPVEGREEALLDADPLLTRDELVAEIQRGGDDVSARDIVYWQTRGVIPHPQRQRHKGATRGTYPQWAINTIHLLKRLQNEGYKLREIGPLLRGDVYHRFIPRPLTLEQEQRQAKRMAKQALAPLVEDLDPRIRSLARIHERLHGGQIGHVEVRLIDDQGMDHAYLFLASDTEEQPQTGSVDGVS